MYLTNLLIENMLKCLDFDEHAIKVILDRVTDFTLGSVVHAMNMGNITYDAVDVDYMVDYILKARGINA